MTNTFNALDYLLQGFSLLKEPKIRPFVLIPLIINILVFTLLIFFAAHWFNFVTNWVDNHIPQWLHWLTWILWFIFVLGAMIIVAFTFTLVANFISAPFNGLLAEKVEYFLIHQETGDTNTFITLVKDIPHIIAREGHKIVYYLPRAFLLLLLFLIPVINVAAGLIWFLFNAWMMTLQYLDYPMDNHRISFQHMRLKMGQNKKSSLIFGSFVLFLTMIPIINFFVMPAAVVGATILFVKEFKPSL